MLLTLCSIYFPGVITNSPNSMLDAKCMIWSKQVPFKMSPTFPRFLDPLESVFRQSLRREPHLKVIKGE